MSKNKNKNAQKQNAGKQLAIVNNKKEEEQEAKTFVYRPTISKPKFNRLLKILSLQAKSHNVDQQEDIADEFIDLYIKSNNGVNDLTVEVDEMKNHYITKGKAKLYPTIVAHLDQVHTVKNKNYRVLRDEDTLYAICRNEASHGDSYTQAGIGGDDLCGVWLCLEMLLVNEVCKVALFVDEEVGLVGSRGCVIQFFENSTFILQGDRKHDSVDYCNKTNSIVVTTPEYEKELLPIMNKFGYSFNTGTSTDIGALLQKGAGCVAGNISCGYHEAHRNVETVRISEVFTSLEFIQEIFNQLSYKRWELKKVMPIHSSSNYTNTGSRHWVYPTEGAKNLNGFERLDNEEFWAKEFGWDNDETDITYEKFSSELEKEMYADLEEGSSMLNERGEYITKPDKDLNLEENDCPKCRVGGAVIIYEEESWAECTMCEFAEALRDWEFRKRQASKP